MVCVKPLGRGKCVTTCTSLFYNLQFLYRHNIGPNIEIFIGRSLNSVDRVYKGILLFFLEKNGICVSFSCI